MDFRNCHLKSLIALVRNAISFIFYFWVCSAILFGNFGSHCGDKILSYCCALERWKKTKWSRFLKMAAIREFPLWLETCVICNRVWSRIQHWWGHAWSPTKQPTTAVRWPQRPILIQASLNLQRKMSEVRKLFTKFNVLIGAGWHVSHQC